MTYRSIKLGVVLTVLALSGVAAQAAQAGEFTAEAYPATVTGNQVTKHTFKFEAGTVEGTLDIVCPEGKEIEFKEAANGCVVKIPSQNGLSTLTYTDHTIAKDLNVDIGVTGMSYTQNGNCAGGMGTFANGEYGSDSTMTDEKEGAADGLIVK
jgi:hypothetical protein